MKTQIGEYLISPCSHGGIWLSKSEESDACGEGMQVYGELLKEFEWLIAKFYRENF